MRHVWIDFNFNLLTYIALGTATFALLTQMTYFWGLFSRLAFHKPKGASDAGDNLPPVSVVIAARNAVVELEKNLPYILYQDYPRFEVVVVNDSSDDGTEELLTELARYEPKLNVVHIRQNLNFFQGKKFPLSLGIKSAKYELLLLTDADCKPTSNQWIKSMISNYGGETEVVIGHGAYTHNKGLLGLLQRYDSILIAMFYLSKALAGKPYMAVGRNLSYTKSLFMNNKGFISHYKVPSGDDDLFIQQVATRRNSRVELRKEAFTYSDPKPTMSLWIRQKRRHISTSNYYRFGIKMLLGLYPLTQFIFLGALVWLLFLPIHWGFPLALFVLRYAQLMLVFGKSARRLHEKFPVVVLPFVELFFLFFNPVILLVNVFSKPVKWM